MAPAPAAPPTTVHRKVFQRSRAANAPESPKKSKALAKLPSIDPVTKPLASTKLSPVSLPISAKMRRTSWSKRCGGILADDDSGSDNELNMVSAQWSERQVSTQSAPDTMMWARSSTVPTFANIVVTPDAGGSGTCSHRLSKWRDPSPSPTPSPASKASGLEFADDTSPASRKATYWRLGSFVLKLARGQSPRRVCVGLLRYDVIKDWFGCLDTDNSGRIDRDEFKNIAQNLSVAFAWDDHQSALLLQEIDTNSDEKVDLPEFADWLTNVHATMTFSPDGYLQTYDLGDTLQPLYECYDPDRSGISKDQFVRTYRIMANALKHTPVAFQKKADSWVRAAEEEYENLNESGKEILIEMDDFIQWQAQLLKHSGIPNSLMPEKVDGLAQALKAGWALISAVLLCCGQALTEQRDDIVETSIFRARQSMTSTTKRLSQMLMKPRSADRFRKLPLWPENCICRAAVSFASFWRQIARKERSQRTSPALDSLLWG